MTAARRRDWGTWLAIVAFGGASAALGWWIGHARQERQAEEAAAAAPVPAHVTVVGIGHGVPAMTLPDLHTGAPTPLVVPGRTRLINFWASWCGPCRDEMPALERFADDQGPNGIEVVGIALDDPEDARRFAAAAGVTFRLLVDTPGVADSSVVLGNRRGLLPYSVLVDADGRLVATHTGPFRDTADVAAWTTRN